MHDTEGPTPAKSPLVTADDMDCVPETPEEGSASKAVHAALSSTAALLEAPPPSVAAPKNMVPESPDQVSLKGLSPEEAVSQPQSSTPAPVQEAIPAGALGIEQGPSQSQDLLLSLGLHHSEDAGMPLPEGQHDSLKTSEATLVPLGAAKGPDGMVLATVLPPAEVVGSILAPVPSVSPLVPTAAIAAQTAEARATAADKADARAVEKGKQVDLAAAGATAPSVTLAPALHRVASTAAAETAATPASHEHASRQPYWLAGQVGGSPMTDSALMAALDSAERKAMKVAVA